MYVRAGGKIVSAVGRYEKLDFGGQTCADPPSQVDEHGRNARHIPLRLNVVFPGNFEKRVVGWVDDPACDWVWLREDAEVWSSRWDHGASIVR